MLREDPIYVIGKLSTGHGCGELVVEAIEVIINVIEKGVDAQGRGSWHQKGYG